VVGVVLEVVLRRAVRALPVVRAERLRAEVLRLRLLEVLRALAVVARLLVLVRLLVALVRRVDGLRAVVVLLSVAGVVPAEEL
jgi:hypothetical protein